MTHKKRTSYDLGSATHGVCCLLLAVVLSQVLPSCHRQNGDQEAFDQATTAYRNGDYDLAIHCYTEAIRIDPESAVNHNNRGVVYGARREPDKAIADYDEAIRLNPSYAAAYQNRAYAFGQKGDAAHVIADLSEAMKLGLRDAKAFNKRGAAYCSQHAYDKAIADFEESIRFDPHFPHPYSELALIWATCREADRRNGKKAVDYARKARELDGNTTLFIETLALAYAEAGDFDQAIQSMNQFLNAPDLTEMAIDKGKRCLALFRDHKPFHAAQ